MLTSTVAPALLVLFGSVERIQIATLEFTRSASGELAQPAVWDELLATQRVVLTSRSTCERASQSARASDTAPSACELVEVRRLPGTSVLEVRQHDRDARRARERVSEVARAYVARVATERQLRSDASTPMAELEMRARNLVHEETALQNTRRENGLASYDPERASAALAGVRDELLRLRIRSIEVQARLTQLEAAYAARRFSVGTFAADPVIRELGLQIAAQEREAASVPSVDAGSEGTVASRPSLAALRGERERLALGHLERERAELALVRDQERRLEELLLAEEQAVAEKEGAGVELRRQERALALAEALYRQAVPTAALGGAQSWSVRLLDEGRDAGWSVPWFAWAGALALLAVGTLAWWRLGGRLRRARLDGAT